MENAEVLLDCRNHHGEGIFWNPADGRIWWSDIHGRHLWWLDPKTPRSGSIPMKDRACCFAPRRNGGFIVAFAREVAFFDPATGATETIHAFEPDKPRHRLNDGRTDRQGRFVAGGMREGSGATTSSVIRVDADATVTTIITDVGIANSTCFSPDGRTMYFADSLVGDIWAYDYDTATGTPGKRRTVKPSSDRVGAPDGSCVDAEGAIWNAEWDGGRVVRVLPDGTIDRVVTLPVPRPTCCAFGGEDLETLYITTSRLELSPEQLAAAPLSGSLFAFRPGVRGLADAPFAG